MIKTHLYFSLVAAEDVSGGTGSSLPGAGLLYIRDFLSWMPTVPFQAQLSGQVMLLFPQLESRRDDFYKSRGIENIFINLPFLAVIVNKDINVE